MIGLILGEATRTDCSSIAYDQDLYDLDNWQKVAGIPEHCCPQQRPASAPKRR